MNTQAEMSRDGFTERTAAVLFKFEKKNIPVTGKLISAGFVTVNGKQVMQYVLESESGESRIKMLATYDLAEKLSPRDVGSLVRITWTGEDETAGRDGNAMRLFKVEVKSPVEDKHPDY